MATSADILNQIQQMGSQVPDFKQQVTQAYDQPVLRPLVQESANLQGQYLPALFQPFTQMGTGAADMSPAAKLSNMASSMGRLQSRIGANQGIQNFYGAQINDLANSMNQRYGQQMSNLNNLYGLTYQREQQAAAQAAQANAARAAAQQQDAVRQAIMRSMGMGGQVAGAQSDPRMSGLQALQNMAFTSDALPNKLNMAIGGLGTLFGAQSPSARNALDEANQAQQIYATTTGRPMPTIYSNLQ